MLAAIAMLTLSCAPKVNITHIKFQAYYDAVPLPCNLRFQHNGELWSLETLGLFMSSLEVYSSAGKMTVIDLVESNWQTKKTVLLWSSPCSGNIESSGNSQNQHVLMQITPEAFIKANQLAFTLAVPFAENHTNPLTQDAPINNPNMFWSWRTGHKFMRMDLQQDNGDDNWAFHLGSLGCASKSSIRAPKNECAKPNRTKFIVEIPPVKKEGSINDTLVVKLNIETLLNNIQLTKSKTCMFTLDQQKNCEQLLQNLTTNQVFSAAWEEASQ
jgi:uncharacterized repeat protein (TIGR04052 family)